jgi:hypothetical protein
MGQRSLAKTVLQNVLSNWAGFAVQAASTLLLTPCILCLGQKMFGVWALIASSTHYCGRAQLSFG